MTELRIKRTYDPPAAEDGVRVLVDRLWPRGLKRDEAKLDAWLKEVAPSDKLRKWFGHDPAKWPEFQRRYRSELANNPELATLRDLIRHNPRVTLLFAARDTEHNNAAVLREICRERQL